MTVPDRGPLGVVLALRAYDVVDLLFHQLGQHAEPDTDAQREQPLLRCPDQLPQRFLHALWEHGLLHCRLRDRYVATHGGSSLDLCGITANAPIGSGRGGGNRRHLKVLRAPGQPRGGWRDGGPDGHPHFVYRRQSILPNNYYFYIRDPDWGPGFIKTVAYAPFPVWVYLNGNEWAKQQAAWQGVAFTALDNGFASCADAEALAAICQSLSADDVRMFFDRWQAALPSPVTPEDRRRGYGHALAFRRLGISDTRMFDRPAAGRAWFEATIPDQLTLGRPDQAAVIFGRRISHQTPGRFHTKVFNRGTEAAIQIHYRASKVKQYFKEGRALRTETTVNDTRDFGVARLLTQENWDALIDIGHHINQRLLDHQLDACQCAPDATRLERVVLPSTTPDGLPAPGLRFGEPRTMALLACLCSFQHLFIGLTNRSLRALIAGVIPGYGAPQMTYDLRRLQRKGFIQRIPRTQRYELTCEGRRLAVFFTKTYTRIVNPQPRRTRPRPPRPDRPTIPPRGLLPRLRARHREQHQTGRHRSLTRHDRSVNPSTA